MFTKNVAFDLVLIGNVPRSAGCTASSCACLAHPRLNTAFGMTYFSLPLRVGWSVSSNTAVYSRSSAVSLAVSEGGVRVVPTHLGIHRHFSATDACRRNRTCFGAGQGLRHWLFCTEVREDTLARYRALFLSLLQTYPCCSLQLKSAFWLEGCQQRPSATTA